MRAKSQLEHVPHLSSKKSKRLATGGRKRKPTRLCTYDSLESRQLLAALVSFNALSGELTVDLTDNNDSAIIAVDTGNITVNGTTDVDSTTAGVQTALANSIRRITVNGDITKTNQTVSLNGDMSTESGRDLSVVSIDAVNQVAINGDYALSNRLDVRLVGVNGGIDDGTTGRIRVAGETDIRANANSVTLNNGANDFMGPVLVSNSGGSEILFADINDFELSELAASGDFQVFALGDVFDVADSMIAVAGVGRFNAANVTLGDNAGDVVNFGGFRATSTGAVELTEDSEVVLTGIVADTLTVNTTEGIFDGRASEIDVAGLATFSATNRIRIGENGSDTFNAGAINFNSQGHVHIWEDSGTLVEGDNTAQSLNLYSIGDITDADNAAINVDVLAGFEGENIVLGDTATDQFNTGALYFYTVGDFNVSEDSGIQITETKNRARRMFLTSTGAITDALGAKTNVELVSSFTASSVNVGDTETDEFNAGSILFNTAGQFRLSENSNTNIVGSSAAANVNITSAGNLSNVFLLEGNGTTLNVETVATFIAENIDLGNELNDTINFGALQFVSDGNVMITEDSSTVLTENSSAGSLTLDSAGELNDVATASLNVVNTASMAGASIVIGDSSEDTFNAQFLMLNSVGDVSVTENSGISLTGISRAATMTLVANGTITDVVGANTVTTGGLVITGTNLVLGDDATDLLSFNSLTFNSTENTNISTDSDIELRGDSQTGGALTLVANGNITDFGQASTTVATNANFTGVDVIIGDLADDCFDILSGAGNLSVTASGTNDVTVAC